MEDAHHEVKGDHTIFVLKVKVLPDSVNTGRVKTEFMRVNFPALKDGPEGQRMMSIITIRKLKSIAEAAGLETSDGLTSDILSALFPAQGETDSILLGQRFVMTYADNSNKKRNDENQQDLEAAAPAPEEG